MRRFARWLCVSSLALVACSSEPELKRVPTQLVLRLDIAPELDSEFNELHAFLAVEESGGWNPRPTPLVLSNASIGSTVDIPVLAVREQDEGAQIEIVVDARVEGKVVARTRVVARFVAGERRWVSATLTSCAGDSLCAEDTCHGLECDVCQPATRSCAPVVVATPVVEPPIPGAGPAEPPGVDAGMQRDASSPTIPTRVIPEAGAPIAPTPPSDAGVRLDAAVPPVPATDGAVAQPPVPDAQVPTPHPDAGPSISACTPGVCPAPYPCEPTPTGYTCRGQFADWPMPDAVAGSAVAPSYMSDGVTVLDTVTGLEWQNMIPQVLAGCTEYSRPSNGGVGPVGEFCLLVEARNYCEALVHGGKSDWRLPSVVELISLLDSSRDDNRYSLNSAYFGIPNWSGFVTTSIYPSMPNYYRGVDFLFRETPPGTHAQVRCVRGGNVPSFPTPKQRYTVNADDTVTDNATRLIWQRSVMPKQYSAEEMDLLAQPCREGFRLPAPNELFTLVDPTRHNPSIDVDAFPDTPADPFWAVRPSPRDQGVTFETGNMQANVENGYIRCVKSP